ncbi:hypothetical protein [Phyllobacterium myrsinacearum]|uniref:hypothetical protein n=1 Tax=Phyllobacterium myrsinacearum TaxID=28101 RepID=UPI00102CD4E5|nr:hypothetical protein [Phyllobacterium myrsinacearum]
MSLPFITGSLSFQSPFARRAVRGSRFGTLRKLTMRDDEDCKKLYSATFPISLAAIILANFAARDLASNTIRHRRPVEDGGGVGIKLPAAGVRH